METRTGQQTPGVGAGSDARGAVEIPPDEVRRRLAATCAAAGSQAAWARLHNVQPQLVSRAILGAAPTYQILFALGLTRRVAYYERQAAKAGVSER